MPQQKQLVSGLGPARIAQWFVINRMWEVNHGPGGWLAYEKKMGRQTPTTRPLSPTSSTSTSSPTQSAKEIHVPGVRHSGFVMWVWQNRGDRQCTGIKGKKIRHMDISFRPQFGVGFFFLFCFGSLWSTAPSPFSNNWIRNANLKHVYGNFKETARRFLVAVNITANWHCRW